MCCLSIWLFWGYALSFLIGASVAVVLLLWLKDVAERQRKQNCNPP